MTRHYCDHCKTEVERPRRYSVEIGQKTLNAELCSGCSDKMHRLFAEFLASAPKRRSFIGWCRGAGTSQYLLLAGSALLLVGFLLQVLQLIARS